MTEENRFLACVREHRQEKARLAQDARTRFECLRSDYVIPRTRDVDSRFECLRSDYVAPTIREREVNPRFECLRSNYTPTSSHTQCYSNNSSPPPRSPDWKPRVETREPLQRPPGLPAPKQKAPLSIENESHFPSLPGSPKTPKTPKTPKLVSEPLKTEIEFIPLPITDPRYVSMIGTEEGEPEQLYKVVRKVSGGSWSDRVKYSQASTSEQAEEDYDFDEDGFPMLRSIESMINHFSDD